MWQAEHLRAWLTGTCANWGELRHGPAGWQYQLLALQGRSPTRADVVHWLPLPRLLDDPDFRPDVRSFQQQLQRALPEL